MRAKLRANTAVLADNRLIGGAVKINRAKSTGGNAIPAAGALVRQQSNTAALPVCQGAIGTGFRTGPDPGAADTNYSCHPAR